MLGDGMVSFGVIPCPTDSFRNAKSSPKMVLSSATRSSTRRAAGVNSMVPASFWNWTFMLSPARSMPPNP
jgi:hypothetical protein